MGTCPQRFGRRRPIFPPTLERQLSRVKLQELCSRGQELKRRSIREINFLEFRDEALDLWYDFLRELHAANEEDIELLEDYANNDVPRLAHLLQDYLGELRNSYGTVRMAAWEINDFVWVIRTNIVAHFVETREGRVFLQV